MNFIQYFVSTFRSKSKPTNSKSNNNINNELDLELKMTRNISKEYDVIIDIQAYENCKIFEDYVTFIDTIHYLSVPFVNRPSYIHPLLQDVNIEIIDDISDAYTKTIIRNN
jgi:hypothetical protein